MYFQFGSPFALFLLLLLPCFFWCKKESTQFYFPKMHWISKHFSLLSWEPWIKILFFGALVLALSEPFLYDSLNTQKRKGRDLVLALDASGSMAQSGFSTKNRFQTKYETNILLAKDFINKRLDDNMGIVIFGTFAYSASPLTYDLKTLQYLLALTNVGIAGESTAIGDALIQSIHTLSYGEAKNKMIILLTDGHHNAGTHTPKEAVTLAKRHHIKIYTVGLGEKSDYDASLLQRISQETGAKSYGAIEAEDLHDIYKEIERLEPSAIRSENYLNKKLFIILPLGFAFLLLLLWTLCRERGYL